MGQTPVELFDQAIEDISSGKTTIFCQTLASALHRFDTMIKCLSDDSVVLRSSEGHRILISFNYKDAGPNYLLTLTNYAGNTNVIHNEFFNFDNMIVYLEQILE